MFVYTCSISLTSRVAQSVKILPKSNIFNFFFLQQPQNYVNFKLKLLQFMNKYEEKRMHQISSVLLVKMVNDLLVFDIFIKKQCMLLSTKIFV
jgi:hypothetical protein